jgi:hypothetical protein
MCTQLLPKFLLELVDGFSRIQTLVDQVNKIYNFRPIFPPTLICLTIKRLTRIITSTVGLVLSAFFGKLIGQETFNTRQATRQCSLYFSHSKTHLCEIEQKRPIYTQS